MPIPRNAVEETTAQEKVYNLYLELSQAQKDKKEAMKMGNENIKRIKEEIQEIIDEAGQDVVDAQKAPE